MHAHVRKCTLNPIRSALPPRSTSSTFLILIHPLLILILIHPLLLLRVRCCAPPPHQVCDMLNPEYYAGAVQLPDGSWTTTKYSDATDIEFGSVLQSHIWERRPLLCSQVLTPSRLTLLTPPCMAGSLAIPTAMHFEFNLILACFAYFSGFAKILVIYPHIVIGQGPRGLARLGGRCWHRNANS